MIPPEELFSKYDKPVPRYTSYPPYPFWDKAFKQEHFLKNFEFHFSKNNSFEISLYIHLPFCESLCFFCGCNKVITKRHNLELPYIHKLLCEFDNYLRLLNKPINIKELHLGGGTPTFFSPENLDFLLKEIFKRAVKTLEHDFSVEIHPKVTTAAHLDILRIHGFNRLSIGVQDFNENIQKIIGREQTYSDIEFCTNYARKIGFSSINFDLIYGLPTQTIDTIKQTLDKVFLLKPDRIAFYSYAHVPALKPSQSKLSAYSLPSGYSKYLIYKTAFDEFKTNGYHNLGFDHFAIETDSLYQAFKQNKLHRNFMGFTEQKSAILLGLGVSAISDFGNYYMQNRKNFTEYLEFTQNGAFNFEAGYIMSEIDIIIKQHILNLSCYHKTSFTENSLPLNLQKNILNKLQPLLDDELISFEENEIFVTELGLPFLRNICFCFDQFTSEQIAKAQSKSI